MTDNINQTSGIPVVPPLITHSQLDDISMEAERVGRVANDLCEWANSAVPGPIALERWRAAAILREMANEKWSDTIRQLRQGLSA